MTVGDPASAASEAADGALKSGLGLDLSFVQNAACDELERKSTQGSGGSRHYTVGLFIGLQPIDVGRAMSDLLPTFGVLADGREHQPAVAFIMLHAQNADAEVLAQDFCSAALGVQYAILQSGVRIVHPDKVKHERVNFKNQSGLYAILFQLFI